MCYPQLMILWFKMMSLSVSFLHNVTRVCLSAGTQERLSPVLRDVTGCWTITAEGTQSYRRSCRSRRRWRPAMSTPSARCWSRATRPRSETPTAGRCCTSLRQRAKSAACACSSNTEVKGLVFRTVAMCRSDLKCQLVRKSKVTWLKIVVGLLDMAKNKFI